MLAALSSQGVRSSLASRRMQRLTSMYRMFLNKGAGYVIFASAADTEG